MKKPIPPELDAIAKTDTCVSFAINGVRVGSKIRAIPHSGNARLHHHERARWNRAWREQTGLTALAHRNGGEWPLAFAAVTVTLHSIQELDEDNAYAAVKPVVDGLKGILIVDDSREHIRLAVKQKKVSHRAEQRVEIEVAG
jgi:hypothetical protein